MVTDVIEAMKSNSLVDKTELLGGDNTQFLSIPCLCHDDSIIAVQPAAKGGSRPSTVKALLEAGASLTTPPAPE